MKFDYTVVVVVCSAHVTMMNVFSPSRVSTEESSAVSESI